MSRCTCTSATRTSPTAPRYAQRLLELLAQ
jgi:hypothetical protein